MSDKSNPDLAQWLEVLDALYGEARDGSLRSLTFMLQKGSDVDRAMIRYFGPPQLTEIACRKTVEKIAAGVELNNPALASVIRRGMPAAGGGGLSAKNRQPQTNTLTLVVQHVCAGDARQAMAAALAEYARDLAAGAAGNGVFERHINAGCRIEAIASIPPVPGTEAREDVVASDALGATAERLHAIAELATYLQGGENDNPTASALGYTRYDAAEALRAMVAEATAALPHTEGDGAEA